jgi:hypothetical protein
MNRLRTATAAILCLFLLGAAAFAQTGESLPYYIEWDAVEGAGGYDIEVTTADGKPALERRMGPEETSVELTLPAGNYRFRIATLNKFLHADSTSDWIAFKVLAYGPPTITKVGQAKIAPGTQANVSIQADMVSSKARAALVSPTGKNVPLTIKKAKGRAFTLTSAPLSERGSYALVLTNPPSFSTERKDAVTVEYPAPAIVSVEPGTVSRVALEDARDAGSAIPLTVKGKNFSPEATVSLKGGKADNPVSLENARVQPGEISGAIPAALEAGSYAVLLKNAPDLPDMPAGTLVVEKRPEPVAEKEPTEKPPKEPKPEKPAVEKTVRAWLSLGASGGAGFMFGDWNDVYGEPLPAGSAFANLYLTPALSPEGGRGFLYSFGLRADFAFMKNDGNGIYVKSEAQTVAITIAPAAEYAFGKFRVRGRIGGGINLLKITASTFASDSTTEETSLDVTGTAGLTLEFHPIERFAVGLDNALFYVANRDPMTRYAGTLSASYAIPINR